MSKVKYYPLNRIRTGQKTAGGEFTLDGKNYVGLYYSTYDGLYFTGVDSIQGPSEQLQVVEDLAKDKKNAKAQTGTYDKLSYKNLLITKPQNQTSFNIVMVFGGIQYATKEWMLDQVIIGQKSMLNSTMMVFVNYTVEYPDAKADLTAYLKEKNYTQTTYSIVGFSAGGINAMNGYITEQQPVLLLGLIDPSISKKIFRKGDINSPIVAQFSSNIRMSYNYSNWTGRKQPNNQLAYPTNYYTMKKVAAAIAQAGGFVETPQDREAKMPGSHSKIPAYFFKTYYNYITSVSNASSAPAQPLDLLPPPSYHLRLTEQDYIAGSTNRYFAKRRDRSGYVIEISSETFTSMRNKEARYDYINYETEMVYWKLTGPAKDIVLDQFNTKSGIETTNKNIVESKDPAFRGLKEFISGEYTKYARITA